MYKVLVTTYVWNKPVPPVVTIIEFDDRDAAIDAEEIINSLEKNASFSQVAARLFH